MRFLFLLFIYLIPTPAGVFAQTPNEKIVLDAESIRFSAMTRKDTAFLKNLLAEDLVYIHSNGLTESKIAHLNSIGSGKMTYSTMEWEPETQVRLYRKWAITNGIVHVIGLLNSNPFDIRLKYTAVYNKKKGGWRLVSWQSSRI